MRARLSTSSRWLKKLAAVTDRTLHYRTSFLCGLCGLCASAFNTSAQTNFAAYWNFSQILPPTQMKRHEVSLTPLFQFTSNGTNLFIGGQTNQYFTDTNNVLVVSNLLPGFRYAVTYKPVADPFYGSKNILFTNVFPSSLTNGAYVNGADPAYLAATTNSSDTSVAANSVFLQRRNDTGSNMTFVGTLELPTGTGQVGYVWTMTDQVTGAGEYQAAQGGSGGSATNVYRSQVSGSGLTISTNTLTLIYTFALSASLQGWGNWTTNTFGALFDLAGSGTTAATAATNALGLSSGLAAFRSTNTFDVAGAATAATNGYPWGVLYDAAGAATAATNALGLASGLAAFRSTNTFDVAGAGTTAATAATNGIGIASSLSAFVPTNRFASSNVATSAAVGLVKVDNSTITVTSDGTISATTGGGGDVTGPGSSTDGNFAEFSGTSGKLLKVGGGKSAASFDLAGAGTTAATAATNSLGTAAWQPSSAFDAAGLATAATNAQAAIILNKIPTNSGTGFNLTVRSNAASANVAMAALGDVTVPTPISANTNAAVNYTNLQAMINDQFEPLSAWVSANVTNIMAVDSNGLPVVVHLGDNVVINGSGNLHSTATGSGSVAGMVASNILVQTTNQIVWDLSTAQHLTLQLNTNLNNLKLTNIWYLTNQYCQLDTWEDTNGTWKILSTNVHSGLLRVLNGAWRGTNASQYDSMMLRLDGTGSNVLARVDTNALPGISFTNTLAGGGGGGGGGGAYTLVASKGKNGTSGDTTTAAVDTTGANLIVALISFSSGSVPTLSDSQGNTWSGGAVGSFPSGKTAIYYCISPSVGSGHTVTVGLVGGCNVEFLAFNKSGGTPVFDATSAGGSTPDWLSTTISPGSITPGSANDLFVCMVTFDIGNGAGHAVNSSYTMIDSPLDNGGVVKQDTAYKIKSSDSSAENPGWTDSAHVDSDAWVIQTSFK